MQLFIDDLLLLIGKDAARLSHRIAFRRNLERGRIDLVSIQLGFPAEFFYSHQVIVTFEPKHSARHRVRDELAWRRVQTISLRAGPPLMTGTTFRRR